MSIYARNQIYRKIYEKHHGPIPKDANGRTYEIHHIDGNKDNNDIVNLIAVSIQEHYAIHHAQEDWAECQAMAIRMGLSHCDLSTLAKENNRKRLEEGTHHFLNKKFQKEKAQKQIENGTHNFLSGNIQRAINDKRVKSGSHNLLSENLPIWNCIHCGKTGKGNSNFKRFHGDNCKYKYKDN